MYKNIVPFKNSKNSTLVKFPMAEYIMERKIRNFVINHFCNDFLASYRKFFLKSNRKSNFLFKEIFFNHYLDIKINDIISSKVIYDNEIISFEKTHEVTSNDIVQGLPKLDSILESSLDVEQTNYRELSVCIPFNSKQDLFITPYKIFFNFVPTRLIKIFGNKYNSRENKEPEIFGWMFFSTIAGRNLYTKILFYCQFKLKTYIVNSLQRIYREQNITIGKKIFESIINVMFSRILIVYSLYNPFNCGETMNFKVFNKILNVSTQLKRPPLIGIPTINGISKSVKESNNLLNSVSFKDTINDLTRRALYNPKDWLISIKADLILSRKLRMGTAINRRTDIYYSIRHLLYNNMNLNEM